MNKLIILLCVVVFCFSTRGEATVCIGYYTSAASVGISNQWGSQGDNFSSVEVRGDISWPSGGYVALYKIPAGGVSLGHWSTYSIALPKRVFVKGVPLDVKVIGRMPFNTPLNQNYNAWLINTVSEGCRDRGLTGWNVVNNTWLSEGSLAIVLQGKGLPSGNYNVQLPYTLAWGADPAQSENDRVKGTWAEIDPVHGTGTFDVSFEVNNKCDISKYKVDFDYGALVPDRINGNQKREKLQLNCISSTDVSLSLSPAIVDLRNGVVAKIKVKDVNNNEVKSINVKENIPVEIKVESELKVVNKITEGNFFGGGVLSVNYE